MGGRVIVLTGPPGAGKSTVAGVIARRAQRGVHLHTDDFWHYIVAGAIPPHEPASATQNHTVMDVIAAAAFTYAAGGFTTVLDGVVGPWMLHHFRDHHPDTALHYVVLRPARDITLARARARTSPNALVDELPITTMWDQFESIGDYEPHVLDTSADTVADTVERVTDVVTSNAFTL